jgi:catechol 2,3-dioxygenase-like lactoylglutathione lyase family enzyme
LHTHYALATPDDRYEGWWDRLSAEFDLEEHRFGDARSLYCYDPDGNCVEIGQRGGGDEPITGIFEVVLEVEDLAAAESFYAALGFETVDRGAERKRVRMTGPVDLELWEPHLGIADARGGVHADLGFAAGDPAGTLDAVDDRLRDRVEVDGGVRARDPDGHWLTVLDGS